MSAIVVGIVLFLFVCIIWFCSAMFAAFRRNQDLKHDAKAIQKSALAAELRERVARRETYNKTKVTMKKRRSINLGEVIREGNEGLPSDS